MRGYYICPDEDPCRCADLLAWGVWMENAANRVVARDVVDGVTVSTVFLGLDHNWGGGPPILWETMIFGGVHEGYCERYSSQETARAGHAKALTLVREGEC